MFKEYVKKYVLYGCNKEIARGKITLYHSVNMHNVTKRCEYTHKYCKFDRLPKTSDGSIEILLQLRCLQRGHDE